ncbi:PREDICTED: NDR1/HIN1-Like protein 3-like [Lupinus angustifolius]|uniref:NDR1/HIN1-Like protein 3-like n=1 Tax=Lupinus angustifolius TaxID=3871 RepID=UPI00092E7117|nr:PREDICTED: NDR1/HIN1-Like protein 3-like [Lupinus angustifolius]
MTDAQRIHPMHDIEASSQRDSSPLVPSNTPKSYNAYNYHHPLPPPPQRTIPVIHSNPPKKRRRSCCCKFFCCIFSTLLILIVAIAITVGVLYLVFRPNLPKYSVDELRIINQFDTSENNNLSVSFNVTITARNPNKNIGIYYVGGSQISAWYEETLLCEGSLPNFYQGHRNITVLNIYMIGQTQDTSDLVNTLEQEQEGNIPLNLKVKQPVRIKLGKLKLFKINFTVWCNLVVDSLSANSDIKVLSNSCKFKFRP